MHASIVVKTSYKTKLTTAGSLDGLTKVLISMDFK